MYIYIVYTEVRSNLRMNVNHHDALKHAISERDAVLRRRLEARRTRSPPSLTTLNDLYAHMISGNDALDDSVRIPLFRSGA
jgi:hypothetical protein